MSKQTFAFAEALEQIRWERDMAMEQLAEHGIPFGGKAPDVVKVVRCGECILRGTVGCAMDGIHLKNNKDHDYCSHGKRRSDK